MRKGLFLILFILSVTHLAQGQDRFVSKQFGFSMLEPAKWTPIGKLELADNLNKVDLKEKTIEKFLAENNGNILLFAYMKYPLNTFNGINPKIEARVISTKLNRPLSFEEFKPAIVAAFRSFGKNYTEYEYVVEPTETVVSGVRSVYQVSQLKIRIKEGSTYISRSRTYAIPYGTYFFQISFVDDPGGKDCSAEFDELIKSIKIGN